MHAYIHTYIHTYIINGIPSLKHTFFCFATTFQSFVFEGDNYSCLIVKIRHRNNLQQIELMYTVYRLAGLIVRHTGTGNTKPEVYKIPGLNVNCIQTRLHTH